MLCSTEGRSAATLRAGMVICCAPPAFVGCFALTLLCCIQEVASLRAERLQHQLVCVHCVALLDLLCQRAGSPSQPVGNCCIAPGCSCACHPCATGSSDSTLSDSTPRGRRRRRATPHLAVDDGVERRHTSRSTTTLSYSAGRGRRRREATPHIAVDDAIERLVVARRR
jgi:hypothetical protein